MFHKTYYGIYESSMRLGRLTLVRSFSLSVIDRDELSSTLLK